MSHFKSLMGYPTKDPYKSILKERETESDNANPRPLPEVEITNESNKLLDRYRELYKSRYSIEPVISNPALANAQTKNLIRKVGIERALALMGQYFKLNGDKDWYVRTGHSLGTLETKIEEINASLGLSMKRGSPTNYDPQIVFDTQCPACKAWHFITCRVSETDKHAYTTHCKTCAES